MSFLCVYHRQDGRPWFGINHCLVCQGRDNQRRGPLPRPNQRCELPYNPVLPGPRVQLVQITYRRAIPLTTQGHGENENKKEGRGLEVEGSANQGDQGEEGTAAVRI
jgi:hypothetical protein